jgi:hypothetical protein
MDQPRQDERAHRDQPKGYHIVPGRRHQQRRDRGANGEAERRSIARFVPVLLKLALFPALLLALLLVLLLAGCIQSPQCDFPPLAILHGHSPHPASAMHLPDAGDGVRG